MGPRHLFLVCLLCKSSQPCVLVHFPSIAIASFYSCHPTIPLFSLSFLYSVFLSVKACRPFDSDVSPSLMPQGDAISPSTQPPLQHTPFDFSGNCTTTPGLHVFKLPLGLPPFYRSFPAGFFFSVPSP